jgi:tetrahydromethanopterin S-methyltransferase subunit D
MRAGGSTMTASVRLARTIFLLCPSHAAPPLLATTLPAVGGGCASAAMTTAISPGTATIRATAGAATTIVVTDWLAELRRRQSPVERNR